MSETVIKVTKSFGGYAHQKCWGTWEGDKPSTNKLLGFLFYGKPSDYAPFGGRDVSINDDGTFYAIVHTD